MKEKQGVLPRKLLFVCLGNICRSPSAEAVMNKLVADAGLEQYFFIDSAGTIGQHEGERADRRMIQHASKRGYDLCSRSRPIKQEDFVQFDLIVAMDHSNVADLKRMCADEANVEKIVYMMSYAQSEEQEVPDPYFGGAAGFELVLDLLEDACEGLLKAEVNRVNNG